MLYLKRKRAPKCPVLEVKRTSHSRTRLSAFDPKADIYASQRCWRWRQTTAAMANLEIGNLQQPAIADPGSGKVSRGLARRTGVAACLMQFRQSIVRPAIGWRAAQRALGLLLRLSVAAKLQQRLQRDRSALHRAFTLHLTRPGAALVHEGQRFWTAHVASLETLEPEACIFDQSLDRAIEMATTAYTFPGRS